MKSRGFIDRAVLYATAGRGGNGCASFRREKYEPRGGPDGGDGGRGGDVLLRGDRDVDSLVAIHYAPHQRAEDAGHGRGKQMHGRNGSNRVVRVPCGTEVHERDGGRLLVDIVEHGQEAVVARGGKGGLGNRHWKSSTHQAPLEYTEGEPGGDVALQLELKLVADVGLVGFPNAGKSSLLRALTDAHPRVAAYPFTTLNPIIGTLVFEDYHRVTVADVPGLIEGAHRGVGLGDAFLRHVERATALVYVIDMAAVDGRTPEHDYASLRNELKLYRADLTERPSLIVAGKMDMPGAREQLDTFIEATGARPLPVSAVEATGIAELAAAIRRLHDSAADEAGRQGQA